MREIAFTVNSKLKLLNIVEDGVDFFLKNQCKLDEDSIYWFKVGFHELLINAYLHGNKKREDLLIEVKVVYKNKKIKANISDCGVGFDIEKIPDPTRPENILKPSGRGLLFVKKACDSVSFKRENNKFTVEITKRVKEVQNA
ncbi:anti-sigma B factor [Thermotomaculum hydrothermale]|uniref:Anti-sigma B factor n=1 Tax=Thermotomaculum hydrothermale TaxID=981385 RepID=A0A7R6PZG9_9BACT|nr:ATP-binding protein [Thermotomaculum hydrothermale]BBB32593.1 anti-sigma B factor [Thermotomaculum hydrothermale]